MYLQQEVMFTTSRWAIEIFNVDKVVKTVRSSMLGLMSLDLAITAALVLLGLESSESVLVEASQFSHLSLTLHVSRISDMHIHTVPLVNL